MLMAKTKTAKSAKTTTSSKTASPAPASAPAPSSPVNNVVVDSPPEHPSHDALLNEFGVFMANLQQVSNHLNTLRSGFKQLEKKVNKELKNYWLHRTNNNTNNN